jgi:hypothetical protein
MNRLRSSARMLFGWEIVLEKIPIKRQLRHYSTPVLNRDECYI